MQQDDMDGLEDDMDGLEADIDELEDDETWWLQDCGWTGDGCEDAGTEMCSFECPFSRELMADTMSSRDHIDHAAPHR